MDANEALVAEIVAAREGKSKRKTREAGAISLQVAPIKAPAKIGRPRKYVPAMLDEVLLSAADGATWDAIGEACCIDPRTAQDWCDPEGSTYNPDFHRAVTRAKDRADNLVLSALYSRATGYDYKEETATPSGVRDLKKKLHPETAAAKSWLANRIGWRGETQRVEADDPLLAIFAAMRSGDDTPAVPETD